MYYVNISQRYELILTNIHWQLENCVCLYLIFTYANIVQTVKMCYTIKIDSRSSKSCFYGVLLCKQHPSLTIAPLLQSNSATIRV